MNLFDLIPHYWLWLALTLIFVVIELNTVALVSIWFVPGCLAALVAGFFTDSLILQLLVFAIFSALALVVTKPLVRRFRARGSRLRTGADRNVGRTATVLQAISPEQPGRVRLDGVDWTAESAEPLYPGDLCTVLDVHGTVLTVAAPHSPGASDAS